MLLFFFTLKVSTSKSGDIRALLEGMAAVARGGCVQSTENRYSFIVHSSIWLYFFMFFIFFCSTPEQNRKTKIIYAPQPHPVHNNTGTREHKQHS